MFNIETTKLYQAQDLDLSGTGKTMGEMTNEELIAEYVKFRKISTGIATSAIEIVLKGRGIWETVQKDYSHLFI